MSGVFEVQIAEFVARAKGNVDLVVRKIALDMFRRVVMKTPVLTGRARGNWQVAIGSMPTGVLEINDKDGTATMSRVQAAVLGLEAGQTIYLVNNLSYARPLEYGHSKQAPAGMVRTTIAEFNAVVNKAAGEVPK
jgi:hypothetical protein